MSLYGGNYQSVIACFRTCHVTDSDSAEIICYTNILQKQLICKCAPFAAYKQYTVHIISPIGDPIPSRVVTAIVNL